VNDHGHSAEVEGFTDEIGTVKLQVVDAITVARTSEGEDVLLRVNHCLHKPDVRASDLIWPVSLLSNNIRARTYTPVY
jgi:hypothetical protein